MDDATLFNPSAVVGTHLKSSRDQSRKRSSTSAKREQSEGRKYLRLERIEAEEDDMAEDDLVQLRSAFKQVMLEKKAQRENRIPGEVRERLRIFCCSCEQNTGTKKGDTREFECTSCGHIKCPACYGGECK